MLITRTVKVVLQRPAIITPAHPAPFNLRSLQRPAQLVVESTHLRQHRLRGLQHGLAAVSAQAVVADVRLHEQVRARGGDAGELLQKTESIERLSHAVLLRVQVRHGLSAAPQRDLDVALRQLGCERRHAQVRWCARRQ